MKMNISRNNTAAAAHWRIDKQMNHAAYNSVLLHINLGCVSLLRSLVSLAVDHEWYKGRKKKTIESRFSLTPFLVGPPCCCVLKALGGGS